MNREAVIKRLAELPEEIEWREEYVLACIVSLEGAKEKLQDEEAALLLNGKIDGKNAEQRQAQLREATKELRKLVADQEANVQDARIRLNKVVNEFKALRTMALLLGGDTGGTGEAVA